jgi:hypothetical protein
MRDVLEFSVYRSIETGMRKKQTNSVKYSALQPRIHSSINNIE